jgi:hypothetical protein
MDTQGLIDLFALRDQRPEITEELHHAWTVAREEGRLAYQAWCAADEHEVDRAYFAYVAAADREEAAALHLQRHLEANPSIGMSPPTPPV